MDEAAPVPTIRLTICAGDGGPVLEVVDIEPIDTTAWAKWPDVPPTGVAVHRPTTDRP